LPRIGCVGGIVPLAVIGVADAAIGLAFGRLGEAGGVIGGEQLVDAGLCRKIGRRGGRRRGGLLRGQRSSKRGGQRQRGNRSDEQAGKCYGNPFEVQAATRKAKSLAMPGPP
jgi:hypothetical protein